VGFARAGDIGKTGACVAEWQGLGPIGVDRPARCCSVQDAVVGQGVRVRVLNIRYMMRLTQCPPSHPLTLSPSHPLTLERQTGGQK